MTTDDEQQEPADRWHAAEEMANAARARVAKMIRFTEQAQLRTGVTSVSRAATAAALEQAAAVATPARQRAQAVLAALQKSQSSSTPERPPAAIIYT